MSASRPNTSSSVLRSDGFSCSVRSIPLVMTVNGIGSARRRQRERRPWPCARVTGPWACWKAAAVEVKAMPATRNCCMTLGREFVLTGRYTRASAVFFRHHWSLLTRLKPRTLIKKYIGARASDSDCPYSGSARAKLSSYPQLSSPPSRLPCLCYGCSSSARHAYHTPLRLTSARPTLGNSVAREKRTTRRSRSHAHSHAHARASIHARADERSHVHHCSHHTLGRTPREGERHRENEAATDTQ